MHLYLENYTRILESWMIYSDVAINSRIKNTNNVAKKEKGVNEMRSVKGSY